MPLQSAPAVISDNGTHHFILTLQRPQGVTSTRSSLVTPRPGATRAEVLSAIIAHYFPELSTGIVILYFSLEPNQL
ncbi:hypothetical protein [Streptomyces sp. N35]|uniref:hypothetical protein n=1 Tax=Streptomyces sp. N35 TaxID=2795730 RepID=UPI001F461C72|nr:hypothetical protein [Streptomyces sp. N35]